MAMLASKHGRARNVNVNLNTAGGNKKQGLPPSSVEHTRLVKTRAGGENRNLVFCMNQLGGVGRGKSQFKVNGSNHPDGSRGCVTAPYPYGGTTAFNGPRLTYLLNQLPDLPEGQLYAAMGKDETVSGDLLGLTSQERAARVVAPNTLVDEINHIIGNPYLYMNREYNGKGMQKLGIHRLVVLTREDEIKLREAGYGVELVRYGDKVFRAFWGGCQASLYDQAFYGEC